MIATSGTVAQRPLTKTTLLVASCLTSMIGGTVSPVLRDLQIAFNHVAGSDVLVRLILTVPALAIVVGSPIAGWIVDRYGRKTLLVACAVLYGFAGGSGFVAPTLGAILLGRACLGLAAAGLMTSVATLITDYYTGSERTKLIAVQAAVMGFSGAVFITLGGMLARYGWRWPFLIYLSAFLVVPLVAVILREPTRISPGRIGSGQAGTIPEIHSGSTRWPVGFMVLVYGVMIVLQISFYLIPVESSFYLNDLVGAGGQLAGAAVAGVTFAFAAGSLWFRHLRNRYTNLQLLTAGLALLAVGYLSMGMATGWALIIIGLPLIGVGFGLSVPNLNVWLADRVPDSIRGRALGLFTTSLFLGQFLSPIVTRPITRAGSVGLTFTVVGIVLGAAAVVATVYPRVHRQRFE